jgi:hypothetical protein
MKYLSLWVFIAKDLNFPALIENITSGILKTPTGILAENGSCSE